MPNTMFRFIHTADLHLDSPLRGLASREEKGSAHRNILFNFPTITRHETCL
jgi:DNA repair exonuclease SbcCD nuclease subunit